MPGENDDNGRVAKRCATSLPWSGDTPTMVPSFRDAESWEPLLVNSLDGWRYQTVGTVPDAPFVRPSLWVDTDNQCVGFYEASRQLVIGVRKNWSEPWAFRRLDSYLAWDSHNYVSLALDTNGHMHVAGNMHSAGISYYRTGDPGDIASLRRHYFMVDVANEQKVTYPEFLVGRDSSFTFWFRDGYSGKGKQRGYLLDKTSGKWQDFLGNPLIDGGTQRSAYLDNNRPVWGQDGLYHVAWLWRDSPRAEESHTICYARSRDLYDWEALDGTRLELPIGYYSAAQVGEAQSRAGLINNNVRLGVNKDGRVAIVYHKRDRNGYQQIYAVISEGDEWVFLQLTDWKVRWDFRGLGSLSFDLEIGSPRFTDNILSVDVKYGHEVVQLNLDTLTGKVDVQSRSFPWYGINGIVSAEGIGHYMLWEQPSYLKRYALLWSSFPPYRDTPINTQTDNSLLWIIERES